MSGLTLPTIPVIPAGTIATAAQMNQLSAACTFLLGKPISSAFDNTGGQSISNTTSTILQLSGSRVDTDGMFSSGNNFFTVNTMGWYRYRYQINVGGTTSGTCYVSWGAVGFGSNSPYFGTSSMQFAQSGAQQDGIFGCNITGGGLVPVLLYPGDEVFLRCKASATGAALVTSSLPPTGAMMEWVSA